MQPTSSVPLRGAVRAYTMFNEDEHQKPIHKLFYLITGTCNCGVRIRVPPPAPAGGFCQPCKPGGGAQKPNVLGMSMLERQEDLQKQRAKPPATSMAPRARARASAAIGVAVLAAGLAWRPTVAAVASVVLVAASCAFIT